MKYIIFKQLLFLNILVLSICNFPLSANERAYQIPSFVNGVKNSIISLNGVWLFRFTPSDHWETVKVPGQLTMQGYSIEHDKPYTYKRTFTVPADFAGHRTILRFDGVYSHARLSINGKFIREHYGGFTRWETDITDFVKVGEKNEIQVEITDRFDDISFASGYASHPVGGILRDVTIFAVPQTHIFDFYLETRMDSLYRDAKLKISYSAENIDKDTEIIYTLFDDAEVKANYSSHVIQNKYMVNIIEVKNPLKWDAEHPNLYTLNVSLLKKGEIISQFNCKVGFREIKIVGERLLVNGQPVKLRGVNRHDTHPVLGRASSVEMDSLDALLIKEANMNYVRTSHYPPSERFVEFCNYYGIYVECETAVCFAGVNRQEYYAPGNTQDDVIFTDRYLSQLKQMVKTFRSNPSVLLWSIGNENIYGKNFQKSWDWIKSTDTTRPVLFSYAGTQKKGNKIYDILTMHYPDINGNMTQEGLTTSNFHGYGIPVLFNEWAHIPSNEFETLQVDPNIREFWGKSIDIMWGKLFESPGGLGGAIWNFSDEIFMLPDPKVGIPWWKEFPRVVRPKGLSYGNCVGAGERGIVDIWRRKKPEFWSTKKAYSPVRLLQEKVTDLIPGQRIIMPLHNRFDHTYLDEIKAFSIYKGVRKELKLPAVEPHHKGILEIDGDNWKTGEKLTLEFWTNDNHFIDGYHITLGEKKIKLPQPVYKGELSIEDTDTQIVIKGNGFEIPFSKETGLICNAKIGDQLLIENGPFLNMVVNLNHLSRADNRDNSKIYKSSDRNWKKTGFAYQIRNNHVWITITGTYGTVSIEIQVNITPEGEIIFEYVTNGEPNGYLRESGLKFYLADAIEHLQWKRNGYWSYYPPNAFAGNEGNVPFYNDGQAPYGKKPIQPWHLDTHSFFYWGEAGAESSKPLTQTIKGMKENLYFYTLSTENKHGFTVVSADASLACRTNRLADEQLVVYVNNRWDYPEIRWNNYCKNIENTPCYGRIKIILL
mgnify:CR=1 FL=1